MMYNPAKDCVQRQAALDARGASVDKEGKVDRSGLEATRLSPS